MRSWANALPPSRDPAATQDQIERHLEFLAATLPSRALDDESGKRRFAVYISLLGGYSNKALAYMARRACETLDWFPTPKQCLELAGEYNPGVDARSSAITQCNHFDQSQFEQWIGSIGDAAPDLNVPAHWIEIALTRTVLRKLDDERIVTRAQFRAARQAEEAA